MHHSPRQLTALLERIGPAKILILIMAVSAGAIIGAMRTTSTTFDELVPMAGGARGYQSGKFDLNPDHPPLMQYLYGLPIFLAGPTFPDDSDAPSATERQTAYGYRYAQRFFFDGANDPERLAFLGRLPAVLCVTLLIGTTYAFVRRHYAPAAGLVAAALVAFQPDVLAHGGIAYNDVPLAAAFLLGLILIDAAVRNPRPASALAAGFITGIAICVKISGGALVACAGVLLALEALHRWKDATWRRSLAVAIAIAALAAYTAVVLVFRGDFLLEQLRAGMAFRVQHMKGGHAAYAVLLGAKEVGGWWYFFPVAFFLKTSAGLHVLMALAAIAFLPALRRQPRRLIKSPLRAPLVGIVIFGSALLSSNLYIGFRYALPILPLIAIITAVGSAHFWRTATPRLRGLAGIALAWLILFPLSYYPHFLSYVSEYGPERDRNYTVLTDSSLDWGQGLLGLRDYMREQGIERIYLSYFGSASPAGYGIDYVPLRSFFMLPAADTVGPTPTHVAISATNLIGAYFPDDPFAMFRDLEPEHVIGHSMFIYRIP